MAYNSSKPAGSDALKISDDSIRANFAQIVDNISNQHVWSDGTAANVVHNRACGIITMDMTTGTSGSHLDVDEDLSFTPNLVEFSWVYANGTTVEITKGTGSYDGTTNTYQICYTTDGSGWLSIIFGAIYLADGGNFKNGICSFGADKFTIRWYKSGSPTGTAYIMYTAFG